MLSKHFPASVVTASCILAFLLTSRLPGQLSPEAAAASMVTPPDLEVSLFACEPDVINPTSMDIDPSGRVWVCEGVNYRGKAHPPFRATGDRIVVLEDRDGDGRADSSRVFHEGLDLQAPLGICWLGDRLLVSQSPRIVSFAILPDGSAGPRQDFLAGFDGVNHDHGVHSMVLGPDGLLYCAFGNSGGRVSDRTGRRISSDGKPYFGGMVFRCDVQGTGLEALAHNFRNNYECALDSFGTIFQSDNDDDGNQWVRFVYVMQGGNYGYLGPGGRHWSEEKKSHWHMEDPGVAPILLRTGAGSPCGVCVYEGDLLPARYRGQPIHADAGPRVVQCFRLRPMGAGYHVEEAPLDASGRQTIETLSTIVRPEALLTSSDSWFRPSDVAAAPDGSLLVADWYDPGVGGHGVGDMTRGRIWRLTPKGHRGYRMPPFDLASSEGILKALASPALAVRSAAQLKLREKGPAAAPLLEASAISGPAVLRARAIWAGASLPGGRGLEGALADPDPRFRVLAVRCYSLFAREKFLELIRPLLADPDAQVRREILLELRPREGAPPAGPGVVDAIVELASRYDGRDRYYLEAVAIASRGRESDVFRALAGRWQGQWTAVQSGLAWVLHPPEAAVYLAEKLADERLTEADRTEVARALAELEGRESPLMLLKVLSSKGPPAVKKEIAEVVEARLSGKWSFLRGRDELRAGAEALLDSAQLRESGARLAGAGGVKALRPRLEALAGDDNAPPAARVAAVQALGGIDDPAAAPFLARLARAGRPESAEAVAALGRLKGAGPLDALRALLLDAPAPELRSAAVRSLGSSKSGALALLDLAQKGELPEAARALATTTVHSSAYEDVRLLADKVLPRPVAGGGRSLPPPAELLKMKGDSGRGRHAFFDEQKGNCARCHRVRKQGKDVGPDLSAIGVKLGREGLLESILSPSASISHEYRVWILQTRSAGFVTGYLVEETPAELVLRDANGQRLVFAKNDVTGRSPSDASLMPEGLVGSMTPRDLMDIVEFLSLQKPEVSGGRTQTLKAWKLAAPFPNPEDSGLDREYPPEKGVELSAQYQGRDGQVRWRGVEADANGYLDLAQAIERSESAVAYLYAAVDSPREQQVDFLIGSDDGVRVWLNGRQVHANHLHRAAAPAQDRVRVELRKGRNEVLVKIDNGDGASGLYFTIDSQEPVTPAAK